MSTFSLSQMAAEFAKLDGRDPDLIHSALRNPSLKRMLRPVPNDAGRTSAGQYSLAEVCRARILLALARSGMDAREIEVVNKVFDEPIIGDVKTFPPSMKGDHSREALPALMRGAKSGENWTILIDIFESGENSRIIKAKIAWPGYESSKRARKALEITENRVHLTTTIVHAADLIEKLVVQADS